MRISALFSKYKEQIAYLFWGVATTAVNLGVYFLCTDVFLANYILSNILAWLVSVLFAFLVNKSFVFASKSWETQVVFPELCKFIGARVFSGFLETGILWLGVDLLQLHDGIVKLLVSVLVVILNYIFSKLFIVRRNENG